jgi:hypothetical protein
VGTAIPVGQAQEIFKASAFFIAPINGNGRCR